MRGYIRQNPTDRMRPKFLREEIASVPFLVLCCGKTDGRRRTRQLRRALHYMAEQGTRQAIMPTQLAPLCREMDIQPISEVSLRLALAEPILERFCMQNGLDIHRSVVRVRAYEADYAVQRLAILLANKARYVELQVSTGAEQLGDWLRREYGLSVGNCGQKPAMQICCGIIGDENVPTLWFGKNCEKYQRVRYQLPPLWQEWTGADPQLLSVLFDEGKLPVEKVGIKSVESNA